MANTWKKLKNYVCLKAWRRLQGDSIKYNFFCFQFICFYFFFCNSIFYLIFWNVLRSILACSWKRRPCPTERIVLSKLYVQWLYAVALVWMSECMKSMKIFFFLVFQWNCCCCAAAVTTFAILDLVNVGAICAFDVC